MAGNLDTTHNIYRYCLVMQTCITKVTCQSHENGASGHSQSTEVLIY